MTEAQNGAIAKGLEVIHMTNSLKLLEAEYTLLKEPFNSSEYMEVVSSVSVRPAETRS